MFFRPRLTTRPATPEDREAVVKLTRSERHVHTHLDWHMPEDWLGRQPFHLALAGHHIAAALAFLPDPPDTGWLRLFVVAGRIAPRQAWEVLWPEARAGLKATRIPLAAALCQDDWLPPLLEASGFRWTHDVVILNRTARPTPASPITAATLRPARPADVDAIAALDTLAFQPPWRNSREALRMALAQSSCSTVAESEEGRVIGFQISTGGVNGGHLARLAVHPQWRGSGLGKALTLEALRYFAASGAWWVSVNTQSDNAASLAVYHSLGFVPTQERFPVYQLPLV